MSADSAFLDSILKSRGLLDTAPVYKLQPYGYKHFGDTLQGWVYPVSDFQGHFMKTMYKGELQTVVRWKNNDSKGKPKYVWPRGQGDAKYYGATPGFTEAVQNTFGWLGITSGEPDTWTMAAAQFSNCINWFGEQNIPDSLVDDLKALQVKRVVIWPDVDETGRMFAAKLYERLKDQFELTAYQLPDEKGYDLNRLWQAHQFNVTAFREALRALPKMDLKALHSEMQRTQKQEPTIAPPSHHGDINPAVTDALRAAALRESGGKGSERKIPILSPRSHKEDHPGQHCTYYPESCSAWEFSKGEWIGAMELCQHWGIDYTALGGFYAPDFKKPSPRKGEANFEAPKPSVDEMESWYSSTRQQSVAVLQELQGHKLPDSEPLEGVIPILHEFGGFARWHWTKKVVLFIGGTGLGKTSLLQDVLEKAQRQGDSSILYTPEWTASEWLYRDMIRYGGDLSFDDISADQVARFEMARDGKVTKGKLLDANKLRTAQNVIEQVQTWQGDCFMVKNPSLAPHQTFDLFRYLVPLKRAEGYRLRIIAVDYIQAVAESNGTAQEWTSYTSFLKDFQKLCEELNVLGIATSQARKDDDQRIRDGKTLTGNTAMGLRIDAANLVVTLNPEFDNEGNMLTSATMSVVKNSMGRTGRKNNIPHNLEILSWGF